MAVGSVGGAPKSWNVYDSDAKFGGCLSFCGLIIMFIRQYDTVSVLTLLDAKCGK